MSRVLVLSPHPDDEAIGCGGTLRKHVLEGDDVRVIHLTSGEKGGHGVSPQETGPKREEEARIAAKILGLKKIEFWHEPDGRLRATRSVVNRLQAFLHEWKPKIVYVPHEREMHRDHQVAARILKRALSGNGFIRPVVRFFEVWTPLQRIHHVVDISEHIETKLAAIRAYQSQCTAMRFDEAFLGLSRYRGEMHSWPGGDYAEIFEHL